MRRLTRSGWLCLLTALFVGTSPALAKQGGKKKKKKKTEDQSEQNNATDSPAPAAGGSRAGLFTALGLESDSIKDADPKIEFGGFSLVAGGEYNLALTPSLLLPLGAGLNYTSMSGESAGDDIKAKLTVTITSLLLDAGVAYRFTPAITGGLFFGYDYGISGDINFELAGTSSKQAMSSSSRTSYGARFLYSLNQNMMIGGDAAAISGSFTLKPDEGGDSSPTDISGSRIRFLFSYLL